MVIYNSKETNRGVSMSVRMLGSTPLQGSVSGELLNNIEGSFTFTQLIAVKSETSNGALYG